MREFNYPAGATPLDASERDGLLLTHITTRSELNRWEQDNINEALAWVENHKLKDILSERFMKLLHKKMFCNVWNWAGQFRQTDKNIGVPWHQIPIALKDLLDTVKYWVDNKTFPEDEAAVRFHHRLVSIHPFPNGNGRHARLATDILLENILNTLRFTWGGANLAKSGDDRKMYIQSLYAADGDDYKLLLKFARS